MDVILGLCVVALVIWAIDRIRDAYIRSTNRTVDKIVKVAGVISAASLLKSIFGKRK